MSLPATLPGKSLHQRVTRPQPQPKSSTDSSSVERHVRDDRVVPGAPAAEEPVGVARARDADHQTPGREGRPFDGQLPSRGAERDDSLVGAERRTDEAQAVEEAEDAALHGVATL